VSAHGADPDAFYRVRVPAQWNRTLEVQALAAEGDALAARLLDEMRRVEATLEVVVETGGAPRRYHLNVRAGALSADPAPARPPFLVLVHDLDSFATLERESGDSVLSFLGTLAGQAGDMKLTPARLRNLRELSGTARLRLTGGAPMELEARFGAAAADAAPDAPRCTLQMASEVFAAMRRGELGAQQAFLGGQIVVEGDLQLAMQLALAALAPD
jgi:hypothetical protein